MRPQSRLPVHVRGVLIGGPHPLVCLPLVGETRTKVLEEAEALVQLQPDLLEWRIDGFESVTNIEQSLTLLKEVRSSIGDTPLIFTCRIDLEGGMREIPRETRLELNVAAMASSDIDLVDVELCNDRAFIDAIKAQARESGTKLIFSYHNFNETPNEQFIHAKLVEAQSAGGDIAKFAAMPIDYGDVLTLLNGIHRARIEAVEVPIVAMSMGPKGAVSRLAGGLFGSDITFAVGLQASAPGQIPIGELRKGMALLYQG